MKLSTLKAAERAAFRLMKCFDIDAKTDSAAKELKEAYTKLWLQRYDAWKQAAVALARKKDKGVVLWTVFKPVYGGRAISEVVRTPNRMISQTRWKSLFTEELQLPLGEPNVEVRNNRVWPAADDFKNHMRQEVAA